MLKIKKQNGITLIALIITVIVMLILVGVTISASLNGGLFTRAKEAASQTEIAAEKDVLQTSALLAMGSDGEVDFAELDKDLPDGFSGSNGIYISPKGNKIAILRNGTIEEGNLTSYVKINVNQSFELLYRVLQDDEEKVMLISANSLFDTSIGSDNYDTANSIDINTVSFEVEANLSSRHGWAPKYSGVRNEHVEALEKTGLSIADDGKSYWVVDVVRDTEFENSIPYFNSNGEYSLEQMCSYTKDSNTGIITETGLGAKTHGARSVITFEAGMLDNLSGTGTEADPFVLEIQP